MKSEVSKSPHILFPADDLNVCDISPLLGDSEEQLLNQNLQKRLSDSDRSVFSSGALKKNLTAEQIKEDLVTLGTHLSLSPPRSITNGAVGQQG